MCQVFFLYILYIYVYIFCCCYIRYYNVYVPPPKKKIIHVQLCQHLLLLHKLL